MNTSTFCTAIAISNVLSMDGQPVLTYDNVAPITGSAYHVYAGSYLDPGPSGPDQTWDFTGFDVDSVIVDSIAAHGPELNCALLAGMNLKDHYDGMLGLTLNSLTCAKLGSPLIGQAWFAGIRKLLTFPMTYGDSLQDNWFVSYLNMNSTYCGGSPVSTFVVADAYGQMLTPFGSFGSVLRIHTYGQFLIGPNLFGFYEYRYYIPGIHYPIVSISMSEFPSLGWGGYPHMINPSTVGIHEGARTLGASIHPNPATEQIFLDLPIRGGHGEVTIRDASGRIVGEEVIVAGEKQQVIDVHALAPGAYSLTWSCASGRSSLGTFIKQ